jgi:hypothetical protein
MNSKGYKEKIIKRINELPLGEPFTASDFSDITDAHTIRELLRRITREDSISQIMPGIYFRPRYSSLLGASRK